MFLYFSAKTNNPFVGFIFAVLNMILLFFLVWVAQGAELSPQGYIPRLNLGVVFKAEPTPLVVGTEMLDLTLVLPYYIRPPIRTYFNHTLENLRFASTANSIMDTNLSVIMAHPLDKLHQEAYDRAFTVFSDLNNTLYVPIGASGTRQIAKL
jgi:hypothetical protein